MILRLMPETITKNWGEISKHVAKSLPERERNERVLNNILRAIMFNQVLCWVSYDEKDSMKPNAVLLTAEIGDMLAEERNMLLYAITRIDEISDEVRQRMYRDGFEALFKYCRAMGYKGIVGFVDDDNEYLKNVLKGQGAKFRTHYAVNVEV